MPKKKAKSPEPLGKKIKKARLDKNLTLDNLANETGLSIEYIKKMESGKLIPPVGVLLQISRALQLDSGFFLRDQGSALSERIKEYSKRTENYAYTTLTPGAENKHLKAFLVSIDPQKDHTGVGYLHEGEEFVYVLSGKIEISVGDHINRLSQGGALHFNSGIRHQMKNVSNETAELLVVIYGP